SLTKPRERPTLQTRPRTTHGGNRRGIGPENHRNAACPAPLLGHRRPRGYGRRPPGTALSRAIVRRCSPRSEHLGSRPQAYCQPGSSAVPARAALATSSEAAASEAAPMTVGVDGIAAHAAASIMTSAYLRMA